MTTLPNRPIFTASRKSLLKALKQVIKGCARGSAALLNTCVLLDVRAPAQGSPYITMAATDLVISVRSRQALRSCLQEGVYTIPGARLYEVLGALRGDDDVTFAPVVKGDAFTIGVSAGKEGRVEFPYIDPTGYPHIYTSQEDGVQRYKLPSGELNNMLQAVKHASTQEVTSNFHGVFLSSNPSCVCTFSEQTSVIAPMKFPEGLLSPAGVLLPLSTVETILGLTESEAEVECGIKCRDNGAPVRVYLRAASSEITIMLPSNTFPTQLPVQLSAQAALPNFWTWHKVRRDDLIATIRLILTVLSGSKGDPIASVRFDAGVMHISAYGPEGRCEQQIPSDTPHDHVYPDGGERECGMSLNHLLAHLQCAGMQIAEEVRIGVGATPLTIQGLQPAPPLSERYTGILQPINLNPTAPVPVHAPAAPATAPVRVVNAPPPVPAPTGAIPEI